MDMWKGFMGVKLSGELPKIVDSSSHLHILQCIVIFMEFQLGKAD